MAKNVKGVQAALILVCGAVMLAAGRALGGRAEPLSIEDALAVGLSFAGLLVIGVWILMLLVAIVVEVLRRQGSARAARAARWMPAVMQRLAVALLGINVLAAPTVAQAAPHLVAPAHSAVLTASDPVLAPVPLRTAAGGVLAAAVSGAPDTAGSPYWTPAEPAAPDSSGPPAPRPAPSTADAPAAPSASPAAPSSAQAEAPAAPAAPPGSDPLNRASGWEPAPVPVDGGPLVRAETRSSIGIEEIVVAPGDSLWSIVATELGPLATTADVAATWPHWYEANQSVIGPDPCLLLPGQVLRAPS